MKRTPLTRKTPLRAKTPLQRFARLRPISEKKRAQREVENARAAREALLFKQAIFGKRCLLCGNTEGQAREASGYGHQAHHVIPRQRLRKIRREDLFWEPLLAVALCEEPCHRHVTDGKEKITREQLGDQWDALVAWAYRERILAVLERQVPV